MTRRIAAATVLTVILCAACTDKSARAPLENGWAPAGACVFVGNRADRHYCATTGTQVLANPAIYNGQLIRLSGWVVTSPDGGNLSLYLTKDALDTTAIQASVGLKGTAKSEIISFATRANSNFKPVSIRVSGRFHLHGLTSDGKRAKQSTNDFFQFGSIEEIAEWDP